MRRIKLTAIGLVLAAAGFVYAAGAAHGPKQSCAMDKASCCAECCKSEAACCKAHETEHRQSPAQAAMPDTKECCAATECCKKDSACCASCHKSGKTDAPQTQSCDMSKEGAQCCAHDKRKTG